METAKRESSSFISKAAVLLCIYGLVTPGAVVGAVDATTPFSNELDVGDDRSLKFGEDSVTPGVETKGSSIMDVVMTAKGEPRTKKNANGIVVHVHEGNVEVCQEPEHFNPELPPYLQSGKAVFCLNGGSCKKHFEKHPDEPCECPAGLTGPHCDFEVGQVPTCDLNCVNGGKCQIGIHYYQQHFFHSNEDLQYCVCPDGYFGRFCEVEGQRCDRLPDEMHEISLTSALAQEPHYCFHGSTCVEQDKPDGTVDYNCDCTSAYKGNVTYAGKYCQYESTMFCSQFADHNGRQFCTNGGVCKGESHLGCDCPGGFTGPICEFEDTQVEHSECSLECENNGICRVGAKDVSFLSDFDFGDNRRLINTTYNEDFEHCVCPRGYVGLRCEYSMDICPGNDHVCFNGGECTPYRDDDGINFECDCTKADEEGLMYAGSYCEYHSTEYCTIDGQMPEREKDAPFCVNEGECRERVSHDQGHPGCRCSEDYEGLRCEYESHTRSATKGGSSVGLVVSIIVGATTAFCVVCVFCALMRSRRKARKAEQYRLEATKLAPAPTMENIQRENEPWLAPDELEELGGFSDYSSNRCGSSGSIRSETSVVSDSDFDFDVYGNGEIVPSSRTAVKRTHSSDEVVVFDEYNEELFLNEYSSVDDYTTNTSLA